MKRLFVAFIAALAIVAVAAPSSNAAPATADISVSFSSDFYSANITSTKGVSHYDIVLCDGTSFRREISQETKELTVGPFDAQIVSIAVKSATTKTTFYSGFTGECKKTPEPPKDPDPKG